MIEIYTFSKEHRKVSHSFPFVSLFHASLQSLLCQVISRKKPCDRFFDLVDLWVMILCARSTSRSREQSTKRRSRSENMWKVCLFYSQNNKIVWLSNMADTFWRNSRGAQRFVGFSWSCFSDADWLGWQTPITWGGKGIHCLWPPITRASFHTLTPSSNVALSSCRT